MNARTPRGFRDILPAEAQIRESTVTSIQDVFALWGYLPVETPTLEMVSAFESFGFANSTTFKLFDSDGELLVMRPDVTLPIARLVGTRIGAPTANEALRLRYKQTVFREERAFETQARALTHVGVECIGPSSLATDAEILLILAEAIDAAGIKDYTIALCTVSFLQAILDACENSATVDNNWRQAVLTAWHKSDLVGIDTLMEDPKIDKRYSQAISALARTQGSAEAIATCRQLILSLKTNGASGDSDIKRLTAGLDRLEKTFSLIKELRPDVDWLIDFSLMGSFDYYTGLMFAAFAPGAGYTLASGGRYDQTLAQFGAPAPAIGFAIFLERVIATLFKTEQLYPENNTGSQIEQIYIDPETPIEGFRQAQKQRALGRSVVLYETEA
jgi:ATP phosphoribosyltransferase regulatory subunit